MASMRHWLGSEVQTRIAGLTGHTIANSSSSDGLAGFIGTLSKAQLAEALMAIAQQLPK